MTDLPGAALLLRPRNRKLAVADADREGFDECRDRVFAVGFDQLGQRGEQARLRQAVAIDAIMARFRPGLVEIAERGLFLLVVRHGFIAIEAEGHGMAHGISDRRHLRVPGRNAATREGLPRGNRSPRAVLKKGLTALEKVRPIVAVFRGR
jgi:hypothetical protein